MKVTKTEMIWLIATVLFYVLYNLPGVPALLDSKGMAVHGILTVVPLWFIAYIGMTKVYSLYKIKDQEKKED